VSLLSGARKPESGRKARREAGKEDAYVVSASTVAWF
jgi:hypothetical protein